MAHPYCTVAPGHEWHGPYHDQEYGFPLHDDAALFERLILEINQAGLSWLTILKKRDAFRRAYGGFDPAVVAAYGLRERRRLLADAGIIRNRLKIDAAIANARRLLELRATHGSFHGWLAAHHPRSRQEWVKLFKQTFRFTGGEIVGEFLMSIGFLEGAHGTECPVYGRILEQKPAWSRATEPGPENRKSATGNRKRSGTGNRKQSATGKRKQSETGTRKRKTGQRADTAP